MMAIDNMQGRILPGGAQPIAHRAMVKEYGGTGTFGVPFQQDSIYSNLSNQPRKCIVSTFAMTSAENKVHDSNRAERRRVAELE